MRSHFRLWIVVVLAAALALVASACGSDDDSTGSTSAPTSAESGGTTKLRIAFIPAFGSLAVHVAETHGFYEDHGIDAELIESVNQNAFVPALGSQYDIIHSSPGDFFPALSRGIELRAIAGMQQTGSDSPASPLVTKDPSIESVADLKGKRVGVVSLAGTGYAAMLYSMDQAALGKDDVMLRPTPFPTMSDQLEADRLDAAVSTAPFFTPLVKDQGYRVAFDLSSEATGANPALQAFLSTSADFAEKNPKAVAGFRAAMADAVEWIEAHPDEAEQELVDWLEIPAEVVKQTPTPLFAAEVTAAELEPWVKVMTGSGQVKGDLPPVEELVIPAGG